LAVELAAAYTSQTATDALDTAPTYGSQLPYTPRHSGSGSLLFNSPWINVGYSLLLQGKRWSSSQNTWEYELKPYAEHTLSLSREFCFRTWRMTLQGTVYNLTDKQYEVISYYPMPGRSWTITMNVEL
ncbi:MAG: TonB-dependent receptor, partial [Prevotella sp.]|nr:TonB-dependent receptor [Prevotella sp.]